MPHIEKAYRIKTDKKYRGIAGLSMGVMVLWYTLLNTRSCFRQLPRERRSISWWPDGWHAWQIIGKMYLDNYMAADLKARIAWTRHGGQFRFGFSAGKTTEQLSGVRYWIVAAMMIFYPKGIACCTLHLLKKKCHMSSGYAMHHNWTYWRTGITNALGIYRW